jgi:hypothetical protein
MNDEPHKPSPAFLAGLAALMVGLGAVVWFGEPGFSGPAWARCLGPALFGVVDGLWLSHDRARAAVGLPRGQNLPLRTGSLIALLAGATVLAVLEQALMSSAFSGAPFWVRVSSVAVLVTLGVSQLSPTVVWAPLLNSATADEGGTRSRRTRG